MAFIRLVVYETLSARSATNTGKEGTYAFDVNQLALQGYLSSSQNIPDVEIVDLTVLSIGRAHHLNLAGIYLDLVYTGAHLAEVVQRKVGHKLPSPRGSIGTQKGKDSIG